MARGIHLCLGLRKESEENVQSMRFPKAALAHVTAKYDRKSSVHENESMTRKQHLTISLPLAMLVV